MHLPKPTGCFATSAAMAEVVLEACSHVGVRIPEDLCVLSGDDDELTVNFTKPPLSSIVLPGQKIGFEAARLLDDLMAGKPGSARSVLLAPVGVVTRQSTNLLAISDPDVLAAVRYMREHLHERVNVDRVLERVPINRRYLERKFKKHLGLSPLQQIRQLRLQKAKELLSGSDFSIPAIAKRSGFPNGERLAQVFRAALGVTPTEYRRQFRLRD
jgi:LacI family transcriptional regulator